MRTLVELLKAAPRADGGAAPYGPHETSRTGAKWLVLVGIATLATYMSALLFFFSVPELGDRPVQSFAHLTRRTAGGIAHYLAALGLPFALYLVGFAASRRWRVPLLPVLGFSFVFGVVLLFVYPVTAIDSFLYGAQARVLTHHGANPLTVPPLTFPDDPLIGWSRFSVDRPTAYGPLWIYLAAIPTLIGGEEAMRVALGMKALSLTALMGSVVLVYKIAEQVRPGSGVAAAYLLGWNPLVLWASAGAGHNDIVMMALVLLAFFLLQRRPGLALAALAAAGMVKYTALVLVPLFIVFLWRRNHSPRFIGGSLVLAFVLGGLLLGPLWEGASTFRGVSEQLWLRATMSPGAILISLDDRFGVPNGDLLARLIFHSAFGGLYGFYLTRISGKIDSLMGAVFGVLFFLLLLATFWFRFWYLIWLVPVAAILPAEKRGLAFVGIAFSGSALLLYLFTDYVWVWLGFGLTLDVAAVATVFLPPILIWVATRRLMQARSSVP